MNEWQPIETAPRDGTQILSYAVSGDHKFAVVAWCTRSKEWFLCDDDQKPDWIDITHWTPLPDAPLSPPVWLSGVLGGGPPAPMGGVGDS